ncbi:MAG: Ig-like domain-containing protein [Amoebophilaceae bacterium]|nr:Ig-like domain-containing protein [Amoebophilaceae bacterium]
MSISFSSLHTLGSCCKYIISLLMVSCVAVQQPEGGPKDETPLKIVRSFPKDSALNFKRNKISVTFNKDIKVDNIYAKLVITPQLEKSKKKQPYTYSVSGKTLALKFNAPLKIDTTYSIHFSEAIKDLHEGLKAVGCLLTFSTGSFIDPMVAAGKVKELLSDKPVGGVSICLYNTERDPKEWEENDTPDYYTTSDKEGNFKIQRIRLGNYYMRATTGKGSKFKIDYEKDQYGFFKTPLNLSDSREDIVIPLITNDVRDLKLLNTVPEKGLCKVVFNKPITTYNLVALQTITAANKLELCSHILSTAPNTLVIYNTLGLLEGERYEAKVAVEDHLHQLLEAPLSIQFKFKEGKIEPEKLTYTLEKRVIDSISSSFEQAILFSKPIKQFNEKLIYFEGKDKEAQKKFLSEKEWEWNVDQTKLTLKKTFSTEELTQIAQEKEKEKEKEQDTTKSVKRFITLSIGEGAFITADKLYNQAGSQAYLLRNEEETGSIAGTITTHFPHFIIELLNDKHKIVDSIRDTTNYHFAMVPPGDYRIRVLVVNEGETAWSPGNIRKNIEPNRVVFYPDKITIMEKMDVQGMDFTC